MMLSQYFHLKPTPSWPAFLLLNTVFAAISYWGGLAVFLKLLFSISVFLFLQAKAKSYDGYMWRFGMILFLAILFAPYLLSETWLSYLQWGFIPLLGLSVWAMHYLSQRMRPESHVIVADASIVAPMDSMRVILYTSTVLFSLSYSISLCLIALWLSSTTSLTQMAATAFFIIFSMVCALARQSILEQQQRILAQGGEWVRIDANGIQMQSWQRPNITNGLKQSGMQQQSIAWQDMVSFYYSKTHVIAETKSQPPHYEQRNLYIPIIAPFYSLNELHDYLQQMKQKFG